MKIPSKQDILNKLLAKAKELYPKNIWIPGLPHTDFAITIPLEEGYRAYAMAVYTMLLTTEQGIYKLVNDLEFQAILRETLGISENEFNAMLHTDIRQRLYPLSPSQGSKSFGIVRVYLYDTTALTIPSQDSIRFIDTNGNKYYPLVFGYMPGVTDEQGRIYVDVPVASIDTGSDKNIDPGSIFSYETDVPSLRVSIQSVTNLVKFLYGRDPETLQDFIARVVKWRSVRNGVSFLAYVENVAYQHGASYVKIIRTGDEHYVRGYGIDVWIIAPEVYVNNTYNALYHKAPIEPVLKVNGDWLIKNPLYDPRYNAYALSIRQKSSEILSSGDEFTYNPTIYEVQRALEGDETWWLGGTSVLVRQAHPVPLHIEVRGRRNPEVPVEELKEKMDAWLRDYYKLGATIHYSDVVNALLDIGMETALLESLVVKNLITGESPDSETLQLEFYQYPILKELVINEV